MPSPDRLVDMHWSTSFCHLLARYSQAVFVNMSTASACTNHGIIYDTAPVTTVFVLAFKFYWFKGFRGAAKMRFVRPGVLKALLCSLGAGGLSRRPCSCCSWVLPAVPAVAAGCIGITAPASSHVSSSGCNVGWQVRAPAALVACCTGVDTGPDVLAALAVTLRLI